MKRTKRIFAIFMTLALAMSMLIVSSAVSFADETTGKTITLTGGKKGHTYTLYQIFTGTANRNELTGIQWGNGVTQDYKDGFSSAAAAAKTYKDADARTKAQELVAGEYLTNGVDKALSSDGDVVFPNLSEGYYVIVDTSSATGAVEGDYYSALIVKVVNDVNGALKADKPSSEKKVKDRNDSATDDVNNDETWQDSADYDIGDDVPFQLKATTANNVTSFKKYHVTFEDVQSAGLDEPNSFTVSVLGQTIELNSNAVGTKGQASTEKTNIEAEVVAPDSGKTFAIKVTLTPKEGTYLTEGNTQAILVNYTSKLNSAAVIGKEGNPNVSYIKYSSNPESSDDHEEGKTPDDKVIVFTYKTVIDKVDETGADLNGAAFTLYKVKDTFTLPTTGSATEKNAAIAASSSVVSTKAIGPAEDGETLTQFSFVGIDDGTYVLCETTTPDGYNTMEPVLFTITATHDADNADPKLLTLTATAPFTDNNIDAGSVERTDTTKTHARESGEAYAEIVNTSGATLPETGGIGTVIFYVLGSLLVVGCGIVLISKRRMESK